MKALRTLLLIALLIGTTVDAGTKVRVDYDQNASFEHLRQYSWAVQVNDNKVDHALSGQLVSDRIRQEIDIELADLGYEESGSRGSAEIARIAAECRADWRVERARRQSRTIRGSSREHSAD